MIPQHVQEMSGFVLVAHAFSIGKIGYQPPRELKIWNFELGDITPFEPEHFQHTGTSRIPAGRTQRTGMDVARENGKSEAFSFLRMGTVFALRPLSRLETRPLLKTKGPINSRRSPKRQRAGWPPNRGDANR